MKQSSKQWNINTKTAKNTWGSTKVDSLGYGRYKPYLTPE